jgi:hypothetical protein
VDDPGIRTLRGLANELPSAGPSEPETAPSLPRTCTTSRPPAPLPPLAARRGAAAARCNTSLHLRVPHARSHRRL